MNLRWIVGYWTCISFTVIGLVAAEEPTAKPPAEEPAATSPEVLELLQKWEAASPQEEVVEIQFERYVYDHTFFTERRGIGRLVVQQPNQGLFELKPMPDQSGAKSKLKGTDGRPYYLDAVSSEMWYWDGKSITQIDTQEKSYRRILIPETQSSPSVNSPAVTGWFNLPPELYSKPQSFFPMVVAFNLQQLLDDYHWTQGQEHAKGLRLIARPVTQMWINEYKQIDVLLDKESLQTYATRVISPTGNTRTVTRIKDMKTDPAQIGDWRPKLSGYKLIDNPGTE